MADNEFPSSPPIPTTRPERKRRLEYLNDFSTPSSDPPVFSSDPPEVALDADRRKRIYRGAWWGEPEEHTTSKTDLARNFDSGVFMPADRHPSFLDQAAALPVVRSSLVASDSSSTPLGRAREVVDEALEKGDEVVDLS
jgi:hypothetical protein